MEKKFNEQYENKIITETNTTSEDSYMQQRIAEATYPDGYIDKDKLKGKGHPTSEAKKLEIEKNKEKNKKATNKKIAEYIKANYFIYFRI